MAWLTGRINMHVTDKDREALESSSDEGQKKVPEKRERRKKGPFEIFQGASNVGGLGLLIFILEALNQQGDVQKNHTSWIHENTLSNRKIEEILVQMRSDFKGDIRQFEMEHARLQGETHQLMLKQEGMNVRMEGMEGNLKNTGWWTSAMDRRAMENHDFEIREWADKRFMRTQDDE